eukprot:CAMPEP_0202882172 /NCGR_PEP_ID=MMETSP1391-20130828/37633_1 /ASSEMBLY_ACC=CAM_ASM_000867 /TAXON_ID=1034604 /ORGANISM="Chlamydomonas leiostraca, Strain SAG 11-49" /LENGTH=192 /DNA_ID=CAMNT_0049564989 /DNA_START=211 /DNA_END=786 /DNA_ORIENTATION=+
MCGRVRVRAALRVRCRVQAVGDGRVVLQELQRLVHQARVALATDVHGDPVEHSPDAVLAAEPQLLHKLHQRPGRRLAPHQPQRARVEEQPVGVGRTQGPRQRVGARLGPPHLEGGPQAVGEDRVTACDDARVGMQSVMALSDMRSIRPCDSTPPAPPCTPMGRQSSLFCQYHAHAMAWLHMAHPCAGSYGSG